MMELDIWQPLAGLGLFLFAMSLIEGALEAVSGRAFRLFLRRNTDRPLRGLASGTLATAVLQSSSLVGLLMLALVGAGVVQMRNALTVIFGANLGTTMTGWIIATIGFKLDLDALALPLIALGGLASMLTRNAQARHYAKLVLGLGLLLMGLMFMKDAMGELGTQIDLEILRGYSALQFLLFGLVFAAVVQSSSATMMVTLSALNGGIIDLPAAAAVAIGADLGTTTTVLIGAIKGSAAKKRVALGHFLFNLGTDLTAFVLRAPLLAAVALLGLSDLLSLVAFHSLFNVLGILLFTPLLGPFSRLLETLVREQSQRTNRHLAPVAASVPETAAEAIELETDHLLQRVISQTLRVTQPPIEIHAGVMPVGVIPEGRRVLSLERSYADAYDASKRLEGEIIAFATDAQTSALEPLQSQRISRCQHIAREAVHAAKSLKDIHHDLVSFGNSPLTAISDYGGRFRDLLKEFYGELFGLRRGRDENPPSLEDFLRLSRLIRQRHDEVHQDIYNDVRTDRLQERDISSLLNVNREVQNSNRALLLALATRLLPDADEETIELVSAAG